MNKTLSAAGRQILKDLLAQCTIPQQNMFKRIWARGRSETELLTVSMDEILASVPDERIDSAISLCERTITKNSDMKPGDYVHYKPSHGLPENGRIKTISEVAAFVVYKCADQWDRYEDYTGQYTDRTDLRPGWVDAEGNSMPTPDKTKGGNNATQ